MKYLFAAVLAVVLSTCTPAMAAPDASVARPTPRIVAPYCTSIKAVNRVISLYRENTTPTEGNLAWDQYVKIGKCFNTPAVVTDVRPVGNPFVLPNSPSLVILQVMTATRADGVAIYFLSRVW